MSAIKQFSRYDAETRYVSRAASTPITVSIDEAAKITSLSSTRIRHLIDEGRLEARRLGSRILVDRSGLERLINNLPSVEQTERVTVRQAVQRIFDEDVFICVGVMGGHVEVTDADDLLALLRDRDAWEKKRRDADNAS